MAQPLQNGRPRTSSGAARLKRANDQFCLPDGVELSGNGHTPFVNLSISIPLSWHVLHTVPVSRSRCTCAEHQSGPPARHCAVVKWLDPGLGVVVPGGLWYAISFGRFGSRMSKTRMPELKKPQANNRFWLSLMQRPGRFRNAAEMD
jgi:hypothetical protein